MRKLGFIVQFNKRTLALSLNVEKLKITIAETTYQTLMELQAALQIFFILCRAVFVCIGHISIYPSFS
ncbi:MAG: hypothetical protein RLZ73_1117 [Bacteroidota bacterium]